MADWVRDKALMSITSSLGTDALIPTHLTATEEISQPFRYEITAVSQIGVIDGNNGLGPVVGCRAMDEALDLAERAGIGFVGVRRSNHFGSAAFYVKRAIRRGLIGFAISNAPPNMAAFGGRERFLGTNPMAVGIPAGGEEPLIFDASSSVVARGKIIVAAHRGKSIPEGWAIDPEGRPTTDARAAQAGAVLPFDGPKGSAISFIIHILSGVLTGASFALHLNTLEDLKTEQNLGQVFAAVRTDLFLPAATGGHQRRIAAAVLNIEFGRMGE